MDLRTILEKFRNGQFTIEQVQKALSIHSIEFASENLAQLDIGREVRKGIPEVIFAEGKKYSHVIKIANAVLSRKGSVVISRVPRADLSKVTSYLKKRRLNVEVGKNSTTVLVTTKQYPTTENESKIGIISAGTSDIGIAEEARLIAKAMGCHAILSYDVGIAGLHRLFPKLRHMMRENVECVVVVAGMEGALPSVVSSMVDVPVIGVPASVGYGFGSAGVAALASMLQTCSFGLAVVNIDNGIGAGAFAALIAKRIAIRTTDAPAKPPAASVSTGAKKI